MNAWTESVTTLWTGREKFPILPAAKKNAREISNKKKPDGDFFSCFFFLFTIPSSVFGFACSSNLPLAHGGFAGPAARRRPLVARHFRLVEGRRIGQRAGAQVRRVVAVRRGVHLQTVGNNDRHDSNSIQWFPLLIFYTLLVHHSARFLRYSCRLIKIVFMVILMKLFWLKGLICFSSTTSKTGKNWTSYTFTVGVYFRVRCFYEVTGIRECQIRHTSYCVVVVFFQFFNEFSFPLLLLYNLPWCHNWAGEIRSITKWNRMQSMT